VARPMIAEQRYSATPPEIYRRLFDDRNCRQ